jgi:hypothetical protein
MGGRPAATDPAITPQACRLVPPRVEKGPDSVENPASVWKRSALRVPSGGDKRARIQGAGASSPTTSRCVHILSRLARTARGPSSTPGRPVVHR